MDNRPQAPPSPLAAPLAYPPMAVKPWANLFLAYAGGFVAGAAFFFLGPGGPVGWLSALPFWTPVALVPLAAWPLAWPSRKAGPWWPIACVALAAAGAFSGEALALVLLTAGSTV